MPAKIIVIVLAALAVLVAMPVTFCVLAVVAVVAEPIRHRRQIRVRTWRSIHRVVTRKYRQAVQDQIVHEEMRILDIQLRDGVLDASR